MTAKAAAARARAKKDADQNLACMAATYRQFVWACAGGVPPGNYYDGGEEFREEWKDKAKAAATTLGLRNENKEG